MARQVEQIIKQMDTTQAAQPGLASLNSPSQTAIYTLWKSIVAITTNFLEQLWDLFRGEVETTISKAEIGSALWYQQKVFEFQYSATIPQVLQVINCKAQYFKIDPALRIITRCSVKTTGSKIVIIKVAKSEPPQMLTPTEKSSLEDYINNISFAGIQTKVITVPSDIFYLRASIYYDGQYSGVIQATVIDAIENYFASLAFDGTLQLLTIEDYIQKVPGVKDVVIVDASVRPDAGIATYLVQNRTVIFSSYPTYAGSVVSETTVGSTLADQLTFIAA